MGINFEVLDDSTESLILSAAALKAVHCLVTEGSQQPACGFEDAKNITDIEPKRCHDDIVGVNGVFNAVKQIFEVLRFVPRKEELHLWCIKQNSTLHVKNRHMHRNIFMTSSK